MISNSLSFIQLKFFYKEIGLMDDEMSEFYLEGFSQNFEKVAESKHNEPANSMNSPVFSGQQMPKVRAVNPWAVIESLPEKQQQIYHRALAENKSFPGLSFLFNLVGQYESPQELDSINGKIFEQNWYQNPYSLDELFEPQNIQHHQNEQIASYLEQVHEKVQKINHMTFTTMNLSKTVSKKFYENFDNFLYLNSHINFMKDVEVAIISFAEAAKKINGPGPELIAEIYNFWMKTFKKFVSEIIKHNEKFTLSFLKKNKDNQSNSSIEFASRSSRMNQSERRRQWKSSELEVLEKMIKKESTFSQATLNKIAEQLGRSPASISSKLQKMLKNRVISNPDYIEGDGMTLFDKITQVLVNYPDGLSRQSVIQRIRQHYEMGFDSSWIKSVSQILSSRPEFVKIRGTYSLNGEHQFDFNKKTFKDKVVNCLLKCKDNKADMRKLVDVYISLYGTSEGISILSEQRRKVIEASISKSLCRYDIFNKSNSKTVYKMREFCQQNEMEMDIESFLS